MTINMNAFRTGNEQQFAMVFHRYHARLCRFALRLLHDRPAAEDMVADSFLALWQQHAVIKSEAHLTAFLYRALRNACTNHRKAQLVRQKAHRQISATAGTLAADPHRLLVGAEELHALRTAAAKLPPRTSQVFQMACIEDRSAGYIARRLGITPKAVLNQRRKAIKEVKEKRGI